MLQRTAASIRCEKYMRDPIFYALRLAVFVAIGNAIGDQLWYGEPRLVKDIIVGLFVGIGVTTA